MVLSAQELYAIDKMAVAGMDNKNIAETVGVPLRKTKRWLHWLCSEGEMVSHNVGRPHGEETGLCLVFSCSRSHLDVCAMCFFCGHSDKTRFNRHVAQVCLP